MSQDFVAFLANTDSKLNAVDFGNLHKAITAIRNKHVGFFSNDVVSLATLKQELELQNAEHFFYQFDLFGNVFEQLQQAMGTFSSEEICVKNMTKQFVQDRELVLTLTLSKPVNVTFKMLGMPDTCNLSLTEAVIDWQMLRSADYGRVEVKNYYFQGLLTVQGKEWTQVRWNKDKTVEVPTFADKLVKLATIEQVVQDFKYLQWNCDLLNLSTVKGNATTCETAGKTMSIYLALHTVKSADKLHLFLPSAMQFETTKNFTILNDTFVVNRLLVRNDSISLVNKDGTISLTTTKNDPLTSVTLVYKPSRYDSSVAMLDKYIPANVRRSQFGLLFQYFENVSVSFQVTCANLLQNNLSQSEVHLQGDCIPIFTFPKLNMQQVKYSCTYSPASNAILNKNATITSAKYNMEWAKFNFQCKQPNIAISTFQKDRAQKIFDMKPKMSSTPKASEFNAMQDLKLFLSHADVPHCDQFVPSNVAIDDFTMTLDLQSFVMRMDLKCANHGDMVVVLDLNSKVAYLDNMIMTRVPKMQYTTDVVFQFCK